MTRLSCPLCSRRFWRRRPWVAHALGHLSGSVDSRERILDSVVPLLRRSAPPAQVLELAAGLLGAAAAPGVFDRLRRVAGRPAEERRATCRAIYDEAMGLAPVARPRFPRVLDRLRRSVA